jgi:hypothetical protein
MQVQEVLQVRYLPLEDLSHLVVMVMELLLVELVQGINMVEDLEQERVVTEVTEGFRVDILDLADLV